MKQHNELQQELLQHVLQYHDSFSSIENLAAAAMATDSELSESELRDRLKGSLVWKLRYFVSLFDVIYYSYIYFFSVCLVPFWCGGNFCVAHYWFVWPSIKNLVNVAGRPEIISWSRIAWPDLTEFALNMNTHSFRVKVLFEDLVNFPSVYINMYKLSCHNFCRGYKIEINSLHLLLI